MLNFFKTKSIFKPPDDDVRFCCSGAAICLKCWPLMTAAVLVTDRRLRGMTHVYVSRHYCWKVFCRMVVRGLWLQTFVVGVFWTTWCALLGVRRTWMCSVVAWQHADFLFDVRNVRVSSRRAAAAQWSIICRWVSYAVYSTWLLTVFVRSWLASDRRTRATSGWCACRNDCIRWWRKQTAGVVMTWQCWCVCCREACDSIRPLFEQ